MKVYVLERFDNKFQLDFDVCSEAQARCRIKSVFRLSDLISCATQSNSFSCLAVQKFLYVFLIMQILCLFSLAAIVIWHPVQYSINGLQND